ncbi:MAG: hypothetical protein AAGA56_23520 [Myxococcota bacterium]
MKTQLMLFALACSGLCAVGACFDREGACLENGLCGDVAALSTGAGAGLGSPTDAGGVGGDPAGGMGGTPTTTGDCTPACGVCQVCEEATCVDATLGTACDDGRCDGGGVCLRGEIDTVEVLDVPGAQPFLGVTIDSGAPLLSGSHRGPAIPLANATSLAASDGNDLVVLRYVPGFAIPFKREYSVSADESGATQMFGEIVTPPAGSLLDSDFVVAGVMSGEPNSGDFNEVFESEHAGDLVVGGLSTSSATAPLGLDWYWRLEREAYKDPFSAVVDPPPDVFQSMSVSSSLVAVTGDIIVRNLASHSPSRSALLFDSERYTEQSSSLVVSNSLGAPSVAATILARSDDSQAAFDPSGDLWWAFSYRGTSAAMRVDSISSGITSTTLPSLESGRAMALVRFASGASATPVRTFLEGIGMPGGATSAVRPQALDADANGVTVAGTLAGPSGFDANIADVATGDDIFLLRLDKNGDVQWAFAIAGTASTYGRTRVNDVVVDDEGDVIVAGRIDGSITDGDLTVDTDGSRSCFVAKVRPPAAAGQDATLLWFRIPEADVDESSCEALAVDASGSIWAVGHASGVGSFAGTQLVSLPFGGNIDQKGFLLRLGR